MDHMSVFIERVHPFYIVMSTIFCQTSLLDKTISKIMNRMRYTFTLTKEDENHDTEFDLWLRECMCLTSLRINSEQRLAMFDACVLDER